MIWLCGSPCSFEFYTIDTDNVQKSLMIAYCEESFFLAEQYAVTKDSKFSIIEYEHYFETFIDGKRAETFVKIKTLNMKKRELFNEYEML